MQKSLFYFVVSVLLFSCKSYKTEYDQLSGEYQRLSHQDSIKKADSVVFAKSLYDSITNSYNLMQDTIVILKHYQDSIKKVPPPPTQIAAGSALYQISIDWCWGVYNPPAQIECLAFPIAGKKLRGMATAHDCIVNAIEAFRNNDIGEAIDWLRAGQCHNGEAQAAIGSAGRTAVEYAVGRYGLYVK